MLPLPFGLNDLFQQRPNIFSINSSNKMITWAKKKPSRLALALESNLQKVKRENKGVVYACRWSTDPVQPVSIGLDACYCCTLTLPVYVVKNTSVPG
ncbi:hypothetical protein T07_6457 [Trichinella nelsoni]|uniref:Uncharacterized protein n=1 Tax=Trichinella nelsoni TaxID=6336 RepID=A0A0V0S675_9BILA|nr:hypothetical protein T07_6457 [Trichinella nelsoni]